MNIVLIIILGLIIGSFLNVCIYRLPRDMSIVKPRSKCTHCDHQIRSWENIPLISYLFLKGKCSSCRTKIPVRYPLVEILTAVVYYIIYFHYGLTIETFVLIAFFSIVIVLTFIDIDFQRLPNNLLIIALIPALIFVFLQFPNNWLNHLIGGLVLTILFLFIGYLGKLVYKVDSMGMGDVKYAGLIGLLLGLKLGMLAFIIAFFSAALLILIMALGKRINRKQRLAFGPFLSLGCFIALFWGAEIIYWYMNFYR